MGRIFSRLLFALVWLLELLLVLALALLLAVWLWSGTGSSLATVLREAAAYLPEDQTLEVQDVQGSVRQGGQIGLLRWKSAELTVSARDVRFEWQPLDLLRRRLRVTTLTLAELQVDDQRPASPNPAEPPPELVLPLDIDLPLTVGVFRLTGAMALEASAIVARYQYQDQHHQLDVDQLHLAQGQYQGRVRLQANVPMALDLHATGQVRTSIGDGQDIMLDASATASGPLAGIAPMLDMQALVQPGPGNTGALANSHAMRARVSARINPWAQQPVIQGQAIGRAHV